MLYTRSALLVFVLAFCLSHATGEEQTPGFSKIKPEKGHYVAIEGGFMVPYKQTIPGTKVTFKMVPVPGGVVELGPRQLGGEFEPGVVSPGVKVKLDPYWIGAREVTWAEYWPFMALNNIFAELAFLRGEQLNNNPTLRDALQERAELKRYLDAKPSHVDGVTAPTPLYDSSIAYYCGEEPEFPAVSMTVYAGKQYTKWLSTISGQQFRLPSEAEWEHAARAGAKGDRPDEQAAKQASWFEDNGDYEVHEVGGKKPNAWGAYDMFGNVAEWVLDAPTGLKPDASKPLAWRQAIALPTKQWPRVAKGGYFESPLSSLTYSGRVLSNDEDWKYSDPNTPKSPWWYADEPAHTVGLRLVRPLRPMDEKAKQLAWLADSPDLEKDIAQRVKEGRGKLQRVDKGLPKAVEQLNSRGIRKVLE